jgi:hypothetical protein
MLPFLSSRAPKNDLITYYYELGSSESQVKSRFGPFLAGKRQFWRAGTPQTALRIRFAGITAHKPQRRGLASKYFEETVFGGLTLYLFFIRIKFLTKGRNTNKLPRLRVAEYTQLSEETLI